MKVTMERSESFKKYTTEKGSLFMNDPEYKHYLRLPYLVQTLDQNDQLLDGLLSNDFPIKLMEESLQEIDKIIFYATKVTKNRSFLTKAFEYNVKNNGSYNNSTIHELYNKVKENIELYTPEAERIQKDIEDVEVLHARLERRYEETKEDFIELVNAQDSKHLLIKPEQLPVQELAHVTTSEKYLNWQYLELAERMFELRKKMASDVPPVPTEKTAEITKKLYRVEWDKIRRAITKPTVIEENI